MPKPTSLLRPALLIALIAATSSAKDQFTPVVASALATTTTPVVGTDGQQHLVYELVITNTNPTQATLKRISVVDATHPEKEIASFEGDGLLSRLRPAIGPTAKNADIGQSTTRLFLIDIALPASEAIPARLMHRFDLLGGPSPAPEAAAPMSYVDAPIQVSKALRVIGPPLKGNLWVATNGCCAAGSVHRGAALALNGGIYIAQRFAIDWMRLDDGGRFVRGDAADVHNYTDYAAEIIAVADGTVVQTQNDLPDQKPGTLPDPRTITVENVDGNHVILDLGGGVYAFYAHMIKGSVVVHKGDRVKRGQLLGKLGNSGNTSAPHLHFQLMDGPSALGSQGIPYAIDSFALAGEVPRAQFDAAPGVEGDWSEGFATTNSAHKKQFPMDLNIVNF